MIYKELRDKIKVLPTAKLRYHALYRDVKFDWREMYGLPFRLTLETKTREFQYKILNRHLPTNIFANKIGIKPSLLCSLLEDVEKSLEYVFTVLHWSDSMAQEPQCERQSLTLTSCLACGTRLMELSFF